MELEEKMEPISTLPVLPRLDRLDRLVQLLEDHKNSSSLRHFPKPKLGDMAEHEDHRKMLSNALDEVHHKGTLMERLEMLEKRVFELSLDIIEEKYSRSSSANLPISEKSGLSSLTKEDDDVIRAPEGKSNPREIQKEAPIKAYAISPKDHKKSGKPMRRKWRSLLRVVCSLL